MKIESESTLDLFRNRPCERCCSRYMVSPHHLFSRGAGRLDIAANLLTLCNDCHTKAHAGNLPRSELLGIVSAREGVLPSSVESTIWFLRRLSKDPRPAEIEAKLKGLTPHVRDLARSVLNDCGLLLPEVKHGQEIDQKSL